MWSKIKSAITTWIGNVSWRTSHTITNEDRDELRSKLKKDYYIILTRHPGHLSAHIIAFAHLMLTGRWGYYGHVLMNVENEVLSDDDYQFIEATGKGVHYSGLKEVFDDQTGAVALLKPKSMTIDEWTTALDHARTNLGKPYDTLFDLTNDQALSCVELVRVALQANPDYKTDFAEFERMIAHSKNLDPQMFLDCSDFEIVWEKRH